MKSNVQFNHILPLLFFSVCMLSIDAYGQPGLEIFPCSQFNVHQKPFEHQWQSGDQSYQLANAEVSDRLMSVDELRELLRNPTTPDVPKLNNPSQPALPTIQLVSFQSPADALEEKNKPDGEEDNVLEKEPETLATKSVSDLRKEIADHKQAALADTQMNEALKTSRLQVLASANENILKINEFLGHKKKFDNQILQINDEKEQLVGRMDEVIEPESPNVDQSTMSEHLIQELNVKRDQLATKKSLLSELENLIQIQSERVTEIPIDRSQATARLDKVRDELAQQLSDSDELDNRLGMILLELQRRAAESELAKLDSEVKRQELGSKVDPIKRDLASRDVKRLEMEVQRWDAATKQLRKNEVREEQLRASQKVETAHPSLKAIAKRNESLVIERKSIEERIQALQLELNKVTTQAENIDERRTEIEKKIEAAGLTGTNGMLLVELRRNLNSTGESHIRIRQLQADLREANLAKVSLIEERDELSDPIGVVDEMINSTDTQDSLTRKALQFVETKREYLDRLSGEYGHYGKTISEVSQARKKLIDQINQTLAYIDANALWIRSADPVDVSNFRSANQGLNKFFDPENWLILALGTQQRVVQRPYEMTLASLSFLVLIGVNRRVKQKMLQAEKNDESST